MEDKFKQFIKQLQSVSLTDAEKNIARAALLSRIRSMQPATPIPSPWSWMMYTRSLQMAFLALIIIVGSGGTLSFAAQGTLPGDPLYSIKTYVNEPLTRIFTVHSPQEYASFETELLNVRLTEAETLDKEQKLNPMLAETVRQAVSEQSAKAESAVLLADAGNVTTDNSEPSIRNTGPSFKGAAKMAPSAAVTPTSTEPFAASTTLMMTMATTAPEATSTATTSESTITVLNTHEEATSTEENDGRNTHVQVDSKFAAFGTTSDRAQVVNKLRDVFEAHKSILQKLNLPEKDAGNDDSEGGK